MAGVVLILLIACTNACESPAGSTADRSTELSIRSALGASRTRLSRQLLTESVLLFARRLSRRTLRRTWTISIATQVQPAPFEIQAYSILDGRVLHFALLFGSHRSSIRAVALVVRRRRARFLSPRFERSTRINSGSPADSRGAGRRSGHAHHRSARGLGGYWKSFSPFDARQSRLRYERSDYRERFARRDYPPTRRQATAML